MKIIQTDIPDVFLIEPKVFGDKRGYFFESFNHKIFQEQKLPTTFVQDNISRSEKYVLRGLHYQIEHAQGKLVFVLDGKVFDVAVDLRKGSKTFGKHVSVVLSADTPRLIWIPPGFAHGFLVMSEFATIFYKVTDFYAPYAERTIMWNDPTLAIAWPLDKDTQPLLSKKDASGVSFSNAETYGSD